MTHSLKIQYRVRAMNSLTALITGHTPSLKLSQHADSFKYLGNINIVHPLQIALQIVKSFMFDIIAARIRSRVNGLPEV